MAPRELTIDPTQDTFDRHGRNWSDAASRPHSAANAWAAGRGEPPP